MWCCSNSRSTRSRAGDGSLCATTGSPATSSIDTCRRLASGCEGGTSSTSSSLPTATSSSPLSAGRNVSAPKSRLPCCTSTAICRAGTRRTSMAMSGHALPEARHQRQQRVHGGLVGADQHAAAPQVAQLAHGRFGLLRQPDEPLPVVLQHPPRVGQRAALRRSVEQLLAEVDLEPPDRLADGGLGAVHLGRGAREAALLGDGEKDPQRGQVHKYMPYCNVMIITLTSSPTGGYN